MCIRDRYAVVAPSIASQFVYAKLGQVVTAIKKLGFYSVVEAALGADIVASVSYTHLDVYKRQLQQLMDENPAKTEEYLDLFVDIQMSIFAKTCPMPVSYTHLDVYKRQDLLMSFCISRHGCATPGV